MKILMVCLGNICRSPLADALVRKKVKDNQLNIQVDSAGTSSFHIGNEPDERTQENARDHGVEMNFLRARQFVKSDFQDFDTIYVMDKSNYSNVISLADSENDVAKVQLILDLVEEDIQEVPDPYYGGESGFENVYNLLDEATNVIIEKYKIQ